MAEHSSMTRGGALWDRLTAFPSQHSGSLLSWIEVDEFYAECCGCRPRIFGMLPFVSSPVELKPRVCLYAKASTSRNYWNLTIELPYLIRLAFRGDPRISI